MFCLPQNITRAFRDKLKTGEINPDMLTNLSSQERRAYFSKLMGDENAKQVNMLLETRLLMKDQQAGLIKWAEQVSGLKPNIKKSIVDRINKMDDILRPETERDFLEDLAEHKLGTAVTMEEAANISELARFTSEAKVAMDNGTQDRMVYGRAREALREYINGLKEESTSMNLKDYAQDPMKAMVDAAGNAKAINASMDDSAIGRQGWRTLLTHPGIWTKNALPTFGYIWKTMGGKNVMREINADILSRPNYDLMERGGLGVNTREEAFPKNWVDRVPGIGRLYRATEAGFTGFSHKTRADLFDYYVDVANKSGNTWAAKLPLVGKAFDKVDVQDKKTIQSIAELVNSLTGRGHLGRFEQVGDLINAPFFSPRFFKSHIDTLLLHPLDPNFNAFARKEAAVNLIKIVSATSAIIGITNAVAPGSVETDATSSDFGKIKVGSTRFDITGGMGSLIVLANRLSQNKIKSGKTGKVYEVSSGKYGSIEGGSIVYDFFSNKLSPAAALLNNMYIRKRDYKGDKYEWKKELPKLVTPIIAQTTADALNKPESADILAIIIADALGISTNTY